MHAFAIYPQRQQKSISHYKSHGRVVTQAPIGNIVYETDDGDNQSNYEQHDVSNIDDDIGPGTGIGTGTGTGTTNGKYSQFDAGNNNDDGENENEFNNRQKVLNTIIDLRDVDDDTDDAQANEKHPRERYPVVYSSATGNLMQRPTEMTHKNWGKWKIEISFA